MPSPGLGIDMVEAMQLEAKCAAVLQNLQERLLEEEHLQQKCHSIMKALDTMMNDPQSGLAIVRQALI